MNLAGTGYRICTYTGTTTTKIIARLKIYVTEETKKYWTATQTHAATRRGASTGRQSCDRSTD
jgi:hypothetical protein